VVRIEVEHGQGEYRMVAAAATHLFFEFGFEMQPIVETRQGIDVGRIPGFGRIVGLLAHPLGLSTKFSEKPT